MTSHVWVHLRWSLYRQDNYSIHRTTTSLFLLIPMCVPLCIRNPIISHPYFSCWIFYSWHCLSPDLQPRLFGHRFLGTIRPSCFKFLAIPMFELLIHIPIIPRYVGYIIYVYIYTHIYPPDILTRAEKRISDPQLYIYNYVHTHMCYIYIYLYHRWPQLTSLEWLGFGESSPIAKKSYVSMNELLLNLLLCQV
jgi:hypothetical protein